MAYEILYTASLPLLDVHIVRTGGSEYFVTSYGGSKKDGGCTKACEHFSRTPYNIGCIIL